jgi:hypothetical protein
MSSRPLMEKSEAVVAGVIGIFSKVEVRLHSLDRKLETGDKGVPGLVSTN